MIAIVEATVDTGSRQLTPSGWEWCGTGRTVQVTVASTLRQLLKNYAAAVGAPLAECRFTGWEAVCGIDLQLFCDRNIAEIRMLKHAHGTRVPVAIDMFRSYSAEEFEQFFPKAHRVGWTKHAYRERPGVQRAHGFIELGLRAMKDAELGEALIVAERVLVEQRGAR